MQRSSGTVACLISIGLVAFTALILTSTAAAQVDTGAILGTVKDESGAVIPGARVSLTNEGTALTLNATTSGDGSYVFTPIKIGTYTVDVESRGFQKSTHPHVAVNVQQQVVVDFTLVPGTVTQTVEVTAAPAQLQTTNASVGQVADTRQINNLLQGQTNATQRYS